MMSAKQIVQALVLVIMDAIVMTWPLTGDSFEQNILISAGKWVTSGIVALSLVWLIRRGGDDD